MSMTTTATFDVLDSFEELKNSGLPEATAKILAKVLHRQTESQSQALQKAVEEQRLATQEALEKYDEAHSKETATKGDLRETELRLQKEIEVVRAEMRVGLEKNHTEIERSRNMLIMTMIGVGGILAGVIIRFMH